MVEREIADSVKQYLRELDRQGYPISFGVVFGSQVKGRTHQFSDIDLVVVSPRFDGRVQRDDIDHLWHVVAEMDHRIEPIPCGVRAWEEDDSSIILEVARREGEKITLN
ncbi:MAG: nucleotidyltransferase domain-containing protein [Candidatus Hydrogenedentes bacterium]|nr:nucleotidyltransferase domain-containing protein [Candidatus Hydrogenedentota bacterium]